MRKKRTEEEGRTTHSLSDFCLPPLPYFFESIGVLQHFSAALVRR